MTLKVPSSSVYPSPYIMLGKSSNLFLHLETSWFTFKTCLLQ